MDWRRSMPLWRREAGDGRPPVAVARHVLAPDREYRGDVHYELELGVILRGAMERQCGDDVQVVRRGQVWLCGMWEPHRYRVLSGPCIALVLVVRPEALATLRLAEPADYRWLAPFTADPTRRPQVPAHARHEAAAWARRMVATLRRPPSPQRGLEQQVLLLELLLTLRRDWTAPAPGARDPEDGARIERAIELLFERRGAISALAAARGVGLSRNRFNRRFAEIMGQTFADFAIRYRLDGAAADLAHGRDPLKAIARAWGFTDASHLVRRFRDHYGCTPASYRARSRASGGG